MAEHKYEPDTPPAQEQSQPGIESDMSPRPAFQDVERRGSGRLEGRRALVTGGDSGIGRATVVAFAREGADVVFTHLAPERDDAEETQKAAARHGRTVEAIEADLLDEGGPERIVAEAVERLGGLDVVVSNAAEQHVVQRFEDLEMELVRRTFETNVLAPIALLRAAVPHLEERGGNIVVTTSVTAFQGHPALVDYASTKGALVALVRSLSAQLAERGIRVNAVAPGPIWTPLIPATFDAEHVESFGGSVPLGRPGQPEEVAESYVFLASADASYMSGQVLHPNGGNVVGG